jgi:hypothetical protein
MDKKECRKLILEDGYVELACLQKYKWKREVLYCFLFKPLT